VFLALLFEKDWGANGVPAEAAIADGKSHAAAFGAHAAREATAKTETPLSHYVKIVKRLTLIGGIRPNLI
jgi:hypothetical protein